MSVDEQPTLPSGFDYEPTKPFRFSLRGLMLFVTCFAIALGVFRWLSILVNNARAAAREAQCASNLELIGIGLMNFHSVKRRFPLAYAADSKDSPLYSWRAKLLPYIESSHTIYMLAADKAWNSAANLPFSRTRIPCFHCKDDAGPAEMTSFVAIVGRHTAWPPDRALSLKEFKNPSKTILLVELHDSKIKWVEPCDLNISELARVKTNCHGGGFHACFADGHVELLPADIDLKQLATMCDPEGS